MPRKKTDTRAEHIERLAEELRADMVKCGIDPTCYGIAVSIASETLYEREQAYKAYIEAGALQTTDKGTSNPYAVRLQSWNSQARACLTMLRLTPPYIRPGQPETESEDDVKL